MRFEINNQIFTVQADKNYRICDTDYPDRSAFLNIYKGRQLNDANIQESIKNYFELSK